MLNLLRSLLHHLLGSLKLLMLRSLKLLRSLLIDLLMNLLGNLLSSVQTGDHLRGNHSLLNLMLRLMNWVFITVSQVGLLHKGLLLDMRNYLLRLMLNMNLRLLNKLLMDLRLLELISVKTRSHDILLRHKLFSIVTGSHNLLGSLLNILWDVRRLLGKNLLAILNLLNLWCLLLQDLL